MRRLGISIYPEKSTKEEIFSYLEKMSKLGFSRIFSCLLSVTKSKEEIKEEFREINEFAKKLGYEIIVDISPKVFKDLDISYENLDFFKEIKADGIRLDQGFTGLEEALMTYNKQGLKIEINMSNDVHTLDTIMDYGPDKYMLYGCHNFYPHKYSGLGLEFFRKCNNRFLSKGIKTAAFVSSNTKNAFGPWLALEGLPTLEMHRNLPIDIQVKHLIAINETDDILISNCYPSEEELEKLSKVNLKLLNLNVELVKTISDIERKIVLEELHYNRGDKSEYLIRSSQPRVKYKNHYFEIHNAPEVIKKGDIIIDSSKYGHYAGELQIALKDMENTGKSNVVGKIVDEEIFLIDYIKPWQKFIFTEK